MKKVFLIGITLMAFMACKDEPKTSDIEVKEVATEIIEKPIDSVVEVEVEVSEPVKKSTKVLKEELTAKGFKIFDYVDEKTKDTVLMQQYFITFLKRGPIRGQNEEEAADLQKAHQAHLGKMYELGYADISGPFGDDGDIHFHKPDGVHIVTCFTSHDVSLNQAMRFLDDIGEALLRSYSPTQLNMSTAPL